jgi:hypothetical protein
MHAPAFAARARDVGGDAPPLEAQQQQPPDDPDSPTVLTTVYCTSGPTKAAVPPQQLGLPAGAVPRANALLRWVTRGSPTNVDMLLCRSANRQVHARLRPC